MWVPTAKASTRCQTAFDSPAARLLCLKGEMTKGSVLTIVDAGAFRGVLGPSRLISKALLEDLVDFIELSAPRTVKVLEERVAEADRKGSWLPATEVERRLKTRRKASQ